MCKLKRNFLLFLGLCTLLPFISACHETPYVNPTKNISKNDIVGTWEANYSSDRLDQLVINADGTYYQIYTDKRNNYKFVSQLNDWELEFYSQDKIRIHFYGARYYLSGIETAELEGYHPPCPIEQPNCWGGLSPPPNPFYDPITKEFFPMIRELIVIVQRTRSGELVLVHMWMSSDRGFALFGREKEEFHKIKSR